MKKYSLYLFDFDLTLFDTTDSLIEAYKQVLKKYGKNTNRTYEEFIGFLGLSLKRFMEHEHIDKEHTAELLSIFHDNASSEEVIKATKLYPDTKDCIDYLIKNKIKFGIVTGAHFDRVKMVFDYNKLPFFKMVCCITNESYKNPKPDGEPITMALKTTGYENKKGEVLYIGDAEQDLLCAKNAGVDCVLVNRENKNKDISSLMDLFK